MKLCKSCKVELQGSFCHNCGQKVITERFTFKRILSDAFSVIFNLEKGFFFTLKELTLYPRKVIVGYLEGETKKYYNPIALVFILGTVGIILSTQLGIFDRMGEDFLEMYRDMGLTEEEIKRNVSGLKYITEFQNIIMLMMIPFISIFTYLFYKSSGYYFAEHNIIICFGTVLIMLAYLVFIFAFYIASDFFWTTMSISMLLNFVIYAYVLRSIFQESWLISFIYSSLAWILGYIITTFLMTLLIGIVVFSMKII